MSRFLIDVNLPRRFHLWATAEFSFVKDFDTSWSDDTIWDHALANGLVIVTVDADFYDRALIATNCPKIVHFKLYNLRLRDWHPLVTRMWPKIVTQIETSRMVIVYRDRIDTLD
jgi:predicted nuclease of predicted toxin-antitoxin system